MSDEITGYQVVEADNVNRISTSVTALMLQGWKLHGPLHVVPDQQYVDESNEQEVKFTYKFYQALFRRAGDN